MEQRKLGQNGALHTVSGHTLMSRRLFFGTEQRYSLLRPSGMDADFTFDFTLAHFFSKDSLIR